MASNFKQFFRKLAGGGPKKSAEYIPYVIPMIQRPPYRFEQLNNFSLILDSDRLLSSPREHLVSKYLNKPLGCSASDCVFRAAKTSPLLILSDVGKSFSIPDKGSISIAYREVSIIIPVIVDDLKTVGYFLPVLFVDGPPAATDQWQGAMPIVIGRELYGLPKIRAQIEFEFDGQRIIKGQVSMFGESLLTVEPANDHDIESDRPMTDKERHAYAERLFGDISPNRDWTGGTTDDGHAVDLVHVGHGNPLIGLRQMRDASALGLAHHQDVVESPYIVDPPKLPRPLGNALTVKFNLSSGLFDALHLQETYELAHPTDGAVYTNIAANFGDPALTRVRHMSSRSGTVG